MFKKALIQPLIYNFGNGAHLTQKSAPVKKAQQIGGTMGTSTEYKRNGISVMNATSLLVLSSLYAYITTDDAHL